VDLMGDAVDELGAAIRDAPVVIPVGARTHSEVGDPVDRPPDALDVRAPAGIVDYEPADLTVRVRAGTSVRELDAALAEHGQECALDPRDRAATVGGVLATGLTGPRRLRTGPLRDCVLEVKFLTADGALVRGGGPTVKNVTGFDLPRLLVGSLGTIGVLVEVILRCRPRPAYAEWSASDDDPGDIRRRAFRPSTILWDGERTHVLVEGVAADVAAEGAAMHTDPVDAPPSLPDGPHRGRISVRPSAVRTLAPLLTPLAVRWHAEIGVGTVHVAADDEAALASARDAAVACGGWMLREAGAPSLSGSGGLLPNPVLQHRLRLAYDPAGKFSPGRLGSRPSPLAATARASG
jgi:glycolate oxidase FAD binding subunit